ncbi:MAG TPA: hypothetical protein VGO64_02915 [Candidatus Limnocylindrales bacterium]|nr:hypothetical protein [Candidatus Limnocylindrales bacterium]
MSVRMEEVLALWREGERILEQLPDDAPDRPMVEAEVESLRDLYHRLTSTIESSGIALETSRARIESSRATLERAKLRLE